MINFIDNLSAAAAKIYEGYIDTLRSEYTKVVSGHNPALPSERRKFEVVAQVRANEMIGEYKATLTQAINILIDTAITDQFSESEVAVAMTDERKREINEQVSWAVDTAARFVMSLAMRDTSHAAKQLKEIGFDVATTMASAGIQNAVKGAVVKKLIKGDIYSKNGKVWPSVGNVRLTTRHHLLTMHNEVIILIASGLGESEFRIANEKGHRYDGLLIAIGGVLHDKYNDVKSKIFHPNSKSLVYRK